MRMDTGKMRYLLATVAVAVCAGTAQAQTYDPATMWKLAGFEP